MMSESNNESKIKKIEPSEIAKQEINSILYNCVSSDREEVKRMLLDVVKEEKVKTFNETKGELVEQGGLTVWLIEQMPWVVDKFREGSSIQELSERLDCDRLVVEQMIRTHMLLMNQLINKDSDD